MRYDNERLALEAASGGKNTLILDDAQKPSVMVRIPRFRICDVIDDGPTDTHPAFIIGGKEVDEIWISKYENVVINDRAYSLAGQDPTVYMSAAGAREYCANKGPGWHLMTHSEYAAIALWCRKNGHMPHGNNWSGCDVNNKHEKAAKAPDHVWANTVNWNNMAMYQRESDGYYIHIGRTLTGTGPATWNHDGTPFGINNLNGNVWEVSAGMRLWNGEIQVIPNNNSAMNVDESRESNEWRAILTNGTYAAPGIANTLKINCTTAGDNTETIHAAGGAPILDIVRDKPAYTGGDVDSDFGYSNRTFESLTAASGVTVPMLAKALGLFPADSNDHGLDYLWTRNYGERLPRRCGNWSNDTNAGVFALHLSDSRVVFGDPVGFRSAFVDPLKLEF